MIGVGNALRGDDAAGLLVARRVRDRGADADVFEHEGDPTGILLAIPILAAFAARRRETAGAVTVPKPTAAA